MTTTEHDPATCEICAGAVKEDLLRRAAPDLLAALKESLPWLEHSMPPAPDHFCGPESQCDGLCAEHFYASEHLRKVRAAIAKAEGN